MDSNETAHKLLYLDTFHGVKRRPYRKKEGLSTMAFEEFRSKQGGHGRGGRDAPGGYSSNFPDGGSRRNLAFRRENGVKHITERIHAPFKPVVQKKTNTAPQATSAANQSNGKSGHGSAGQFPIDSVLNVSKSSSAANDTANQANVQPQAVAVAEASSPTQTLGAVTRTDELKSMASSDQLQTFVSGVYFSSSDPVLASSISQNPSVNGAINREVGSNFISVGLSPVEGNKLQEVGDSSVSKNEKPGSMNSTNNLNAVRRSNEVENDQLSELSQLSSSSSPNGSLRSSSNNGSQPSPANVTEVSTSEACVQSSAEMRQHVTFPNHFQAPEALKIGLTFGSFDTFCPSERSSSGTGCDDNSSPTLESSIGDHETATFSNQNGSLAERGDRLDYSDSSYSIKKIPASDGNSITSIVSKADQPKQEVLLAPEGHPILTVQSIQKCGLNFMSTVLGTQQVQFEGTEAQKNPRFPSFVSGSYQTVSPSPTPPLQSSIPVPPHPVYPSTFFPYGHYYPQIYFSPMHQFLSHNGFAEQPSAGNMYLPATTATGAAAGIKFPLLFKAGANTGNAAPIGIPSGSFITPPVGYAPSPTVNTGSSTGTEDLIISQMKENQIYTTGQLNEGSAVWIQAPGQDILSLQVNPLYNLTPYGQHLTFPQTQAGHGAFTGIYQPMQTVASPSTLLKQAQAVAVETVGPPTGSYQLPQPAQINWNSNF